MRDKFFLCVWEIKAFIFIYYYFHYVFLNGQQLAYHYVAEINANIKRYVCVLVAVN